MSPWLKVALVVVAAAVGTQVLVGTRGRDGRGAQAPRLEARDLEGRPVTLEGLRGRAVAVNFWATWCGPCRVEMPELADVWRRNHDRCFEILGVAEESASDDVTRAARTVPYPILLDDRARAAAAWKVQGYPQTFLVDAAGRVVRTFRGAVTGQELEEALRAVLPASCPSR
jgi:cytochrome c biogenesis protein CcmG/thiol:disulfide interchange protein DsbE